MLNDLMGFDRVAPDPDWVDPGTSYPTCWLDAISRSLYEAWVEMLLKN